LKSHHHFKVSAESEKFQLKFCPHDEKLILF